MSPNAYILLERGTSPMESIYADVEGRLAFTISSYREPNLLVRVNREKGWAQQHASDIKGSSSAFLYFDHARRPAHVAFGAGERQRAADWLRPARKDARVRAFTSQSIGEFGGEYKWRACSSEKLELLKGSAVIATWERKLDVDGNDAQLTLKHAALPIITDVLATLTLNRMRLELGWE